MVAMRHGFHLQRSKFWVTGSQAVRLCGTKPKRGQIPAQIKLASEAVFELHGQSAHTRALLEAHPPYFGSGVGIFTDGKWREVRQGAIVKKLNPRGEQRKLFIDRDTAEDLGFAGKREPVVLSGGYISLFHASQLEEPERCVPPLGLAINPATGRRWAQPAHDVLLSASILRGHVNPFWITKRQAQRYFKVDIVHPERTVTTPTRVGRFVPINTLPRADRSRLLSKLDATAHDSSVSIFEHQSWLAVDSPAASQALSAHKHWISVDDGTVHKDRVNARHVVDLATVTRETFVNAQDTSDPSVVQPRDRPFVLVSGRFVAPTFADQLLRVAVECDYASPLWVTVTDCARMGVGIRAGQRPTRLSLGDGVEEFLHNVEDIENYKAFLDENPPLDTELPQVFLVGWRPIVSPGKRNALDAFKRALPLWISTTEVSISGLRVKKGAKRYRVLSGRVGRRRQNEGPQAARLVYNAQQTTDPVRVLATMPLFARAKTF